MSHDGHDELRDRLRRSDPADSLPPADPTRVARLLEDVMSTEVTTETRESGTRDRGPLTWLVAAAAVVIIAGAAVFGVLSHDDDAASPPTAADAKTVTELSAPSSAAYDAKCMVPSAAVVSRQSVAIDGTVTTLTDGVITLTVNHWYAGAPTDVVRVQAPAADLQELVGAVGFEEGGRYLVSATDGRVTVCGFSAPYSTALADVYEEAFPA